MENTTGLEITVIGMAGKFPGAKNIHEFWHNLKNGIESISYFSDEELKESGVETVLLRDINYVKAYGILDDIEYFDAPFFGYTPKEAEIMDPQARIFHECVWTALEDAGYDPASYDGFIGLYAGATPNIEWAARALISGKSNEIGYFAAQHLHQKDYLSLRISYKLNLTGPSFSLNTACSTSLVAIHVACQSLLNGECDLALAGGITVTKLDKSGYLYQPGMILSPDGHCRTFDARAQGTVGGNGAGVVLLKRLENAVRDRDHIYAVVKSSVINNDGIRKAGFTAASVDGQAEVIRMALQMAEVEPESFGYVENHGTGTKLGDPVEIEALKLAFNTNKKGFCAIGSVKTNMGHLDAAAGVVGFLKTVLILKYRLIPPSLHFETPNPHIDFIDSPFYVNTKLSEWEKERESLCAGVSSFGIGGTNAHVVLEKWSGGDESGEEYSPSSIETDNERLLLLSARTPAALEQAKENLASCLRKNAEVNLADIFYTLQVGRRFFNHRWMAVCSTTTEAIEVLTSTGSGTDHVCKGEEETPGLVKVEPTVDRESLTRIGQLWLQGKNIDWQAFHSGENRYRLSLPTYPFEKQHYWIDADSLNSSAIMDKQTRGTPDMADWFYLPTWKRSFLEVEERETSSFKQKWLVFMEDLNLGVLLVKHLEETHPEVLVVKKGGGFDQVKTGIYTVNPGNYTDYERLFTHLKARQYMPDKVLHLWSVTEKKTDEAQAGVEYFERAQDLGFFSLLFIAKELGKGDFSGDICIYVLTNHLQDVSGIEELDPFKSPVLGLLKVIPQEIPGLRSSNIDIQLPEADSSEEKTLVHLLGKELTIGPGDMDTNIAYRCNRRWVQMYDALHLEKRSHNNFGLRENGVYLITGGLGRIGLMFSELLVKHARARLILTGRSSFPAREEWGQWLAAHSGGEEDPISFKITKLKAIEEMAGEVIYMEADSASLEQMREAVNYAENTWGQVDGIIHAAGVTEGQSMRALQDLTPEDCRRQFQAKVKGLLVLNALFKDKEPDFCWVLSSISCVLGGLGFGAYASANQFMDVFVKHHNRRVRPGSRWFTLNWDGMDTTRSIDMFERMFPLKTIDQLVVSNGGNLQSRIREWIKLETLKNRESLKKKNPMTHYPRPLLSTSYVAPRTPGEKTVAQIWSKLLGFSKIGVRDDFLELGGDSLKAITVISHLHRELKVNIPVTNFFNQPTIEGIVQYISNHPAHDPRSSIEIKPTEKKEYYTLSSGQKRLYTIQQMEPASTSYNMTYISTIRFGYNKTRLEKAFGKLIERHESLRTSFHIINDKPMQKIHDHIRAAFNIQYDEAEDEVKVKEIINYFVRPFDLAEAPLLRVGLIQTNEKQHPYILMVEMHHIISDGISLDIFVNDFLQLYKKTESTKEEELPTPRFQYKDFSGWQNSRWERGAIKNQQEYWLEEFKGEIPILNMPFDYVRPPVQSFEGNFISFEISKEETTAINEMARSEGATLFLVLLAVYYIFLSKISGQEDIIVGTPVVGRGDPRLNQIMGIFVNTLALRNCLPGEMNLKRFLNEVKKSH